MSLSMFQAINQEIYPIPNQIDYTKGILNSYATDDPVVDNLQDLHNKVSDVEKTYKELSTNISNLLADMETGSETIDHFKVIFI